MGGARGWQIRFLVFLGLAVILEVLRLVDPSFMTRRGATYPDILEFVFVAIMLVSFIVWRSLAGRKA